MRGTHRMTGAPPGGPAADAPLTIRRRLCGALAASPEALAAAEPADRDHLERWMASFDKPASALTCALAAQVLDQPMTWVLCGDDHARREAHLQAIIAALQDDKTRLISEIDELHAQLFQQA